MKILVGLLDLSSTELGLWGFWVKEDWRRKKVERERDQKEREKERTVLFFLYMLKSKLKIRPSSGDSSSSSRACDCLKNSTRSLEKLFIRCYPLKTLHQIPHISNWKPTMMRGLLKTSLCQRRIYQTPPFLTTPHSQTSPWGNDFNFSSSYSSSVAP